ncbi:MAG: 4Fe-4S dicluster domain-containing protein [Nitrospinae bacterium]|nr:4Fe-4S dicluster domain-containing protein [Nitrospinota bacterium]
MNRREFVRAGALVGVSALASASVVIKDRIITSDKDTTGKETARNLKIRAVEKASENEDILIRMQRDLARAMAKPVESRRWIMVIDQRKCVGCSACTIGCVAENKLPPGVVYRPVISEESGQYPNTKLVFTPRPCMQCSKPPCVPVCPVKATWKRPDGVVAIDYDACIGCRYCIAACPYGARTSDFGEYYSKGTAFGAGEAKENPLVGSSPYEEKPNFEYGKSWSRANHGSPMGNARKCHFCLHRLEAGQLPTCVTTCIGRATYFGDANDPDSLVVEMVAKNNVRALLPHKETEPNVFYI